MTTVKSKVLRDSSFKSSYAGTVVPGPGSSTSPSSFGGDTYTYVDNASITYVSTPGYARISAAGGIVNSPMSRSEITTSPGNGTRVAYRHINGDVTTVTGDVAGWIVGADNIGFASPPGSFSQDLAKKSSNAYLQCLANLDSTPFSFMEDVAEIGKTFQTLRNPLNLAAELAKIYRRKKSGFITSGLTDAQAAAKAWLSVRYQYRPIVMSVMNALESAKTSSKRPARQTARSQYEASWNISTQVKNYTGERTYLLEGHGSTRGRYGILYHVNQPGGFAWKNGLRVKDVPATVWAIMPYSWVIDRFVNVSNLVKAYTNASDPYLEVLAAWHTVDSEETGSISYLKDDNPSQTITISAGPMSKKIKSKTRNPIDVKQLWRIPTPKYDGSTWRSITQTADLVALVLGRLK